MMKRNTIDALMNIQMLIINLLPPSFWKWEGGVRAVGEKVEQDVTYLLLSCFRQPRFGSSFTDWKRRILHGRATQKGHTGDNPTCHCIRTVPFHPLFHVNPTAYFLLALLHICKIRRSILHVRTSIDDLNLKTMAPSLIMYAICYSREKEKVHPHAPLLGLHAFYI